MIELTRRERDALAAALRYPMGDEPLVVPDAALPFALDVLGRYVGSLYGESPVTKGSAAVGLIAMIAQHLQRTEAH